MVYTLRFFFSSKCSLFHNSNVFGSYIIHILYTGCAKIKKNNSGAKRLRLVDRRIQLVRLGGKKPGTQKFSACETFEKCTRNVTAGGTDQRTLHAIPSHT